MADGAEKSADAMLEDLEAEIDGEGGPNEGAERKDSLDIKPSIAEDSKGGDSKANGDSNEGDDKDEDEDEDEYEDDDEDEVELLLEEDDVPTAPEPNQHQKTYVNILDSKLPTVKPSLARVPSTSSAASAIVPGSPSTAVTAAAAATTGAAPVAAPSNAPKLPKPNAAVYEIDLEDTDKPWRQPGADITDYFNYGFTEETWNKYRKEQIKFRQMESINKSQIETIESHGAKGAGNGSSVSSALQMLNSYDQRHNNNNVHSSSSHNNNNNNNNRPPYMYQQQQQQQQHYQQQRQHQPPAAAAAAQHQQQPIHQRRSRFGPPPSEGKDNSMEATESSSSAAPNSATPQQEQGQPQHTAKGEGGGGEDGGPSTAETGTGEMRVKVEGEGNNEQQGAPPPQWHPEDGGPRHWGPGPGPRHEYPGPRGGGGGGGGGGGRDFNNEFDRRGRPPFDVSALRVADGGCCVSLQPSPTRENATALRRPWPRGPPSTSPSAAFRRGRAAAAALRRPPTPF
eukprot:jgi/Bigna1/75090/fgenesh1_pg.32_\